MTLFRGKLKLLAVLSIGLALTGCTRPLNQYGIANKAAIVEMQAIGRQNGFAMRGEPTIGCAIAFDCSPTQEFSLSSDEGPTQVKPAEACASFVKFAHALKADSFDSSNSSTPLTAKLSELTDDQMVSSCVSAIEPSLENPDFSVLERVESMPVHVFGTFVTADNKEVPFACQFDGYKDKDGTSGYYIYISANSEPVSDS